MDIHTLVTAVVTTVVTTIAIGFSKWTFALLDAIIPVSTANEKIRKIFSVKLHRQLLVGALWLALCGFSIIFFVRDSWHPITRFTIIEGCLLFFNLVFAVGNIFFDLVIARIRRSRLP